MDSESHATPQAEQPDGKESVHMPRPTVAPIVVALGTTLLVAGFVVGLTVGIVGGLILIAGIGTWIANLLPGRGHLWEPLTAGPQPIKATPGTVERLVQGMPGYRLRLPEKVHPISAGIRGGIYGGIVMPVPALLYSLFSGHGVWYAVNLLSGTVIPGVGEMSVAELGQFHLLLLVVGLCVHAVMSVTLGLLYGVLMATLPEVPKALAWGGVLMPILWTAVTYGSMAIVNPALYQGVDWSWFILSQFVFGVVSALVAMRFAHLRPVVLPGILGGLCGGLLMPLPALAWSLSKGFGIWYPANLLAGTVLRGLDKLPHSQLTQFNAGWLTTAIVIHVSFSLIFGLCYGIVLPKLPTIPGPFVWGGLLMPALWTAASFGLMGVVNPALQERVNWPWFVVSQFVFGVVAAIAIYRSEEIRILPAGRGSGADRT